MTTTQKIMDVLKETASSTDGLGLIHESINTFNIVWIAKAGEMDGELGAT
jgi:hypothetical protein